MTLILTAIVNHQTVTTAGEENLYVRFGYDPQKICNQIPGQVSVSMNGDIVNIIYKIQQSTKKGLFEELDGYFRSSKAIN